MKTGGPKQKWSGLGDDITHDPYTRENEYKQTKQKKQKKVATEIQTEMYIYTLVIYKNKVSLGGTS